MIGPKKSAKRSLGKKGNLKKQPAEKMVSGEKAKARRAFSRVASAHVQAMEEAVWRHAETAEVNNQPQETQMV